MLSLIKAFFVMIATMFAAKDKTKDPCPRGHAMHASWEQCPICSVWPEQAVSIKTGNRPVAAVRIKDGNEFFRTRLLYGGTMTLGHRADCDLVLTPNRTTDITESVAELVIEENQATLRTKNREKALRINGADYRETPLFDRDHVELYGAEMEVLFL